MSIDSRSSLRFTAVAAVALLAACSNPVGDDQDHHEEPEGVVITTLANAPIATFADGAWTFASGDALHLHVGEETEVRIYFVAEDGDRFQLPDSAAEYTLNVEIAHPTIAAYEGHGDHGDFEGLSAGQTTARVQVYHGGHHDWTTTPMPIEVVIDD